MPRPRRTVSPEPLGASVRLVRRALNYSSMSTPQVLQAISGKLFREQAKATVQWNEMLEEIRDGLRLTFKKLVDALVGKLTQEAGGSGILYGLSPPHNSLNGQRFQRQGTGIELFCSSYQTCDHFPSPFRSPRGNRTIRGSPGSLRRNSSPSHELVVSLRRALFAGVRRGSLSGSLNWRPGRRT
jgi:hypothetical protein